MDELPDGARRGWTPLMQAVRDGDARAVERALAGGADVDAIAEGAVTALSIACQRGTDSIATMLLAAGADPRARTRGEVTMLHLAVAHGSLALVRRLVEAGAQVEPDGLARVPSAPLSVAIERDRMDMLAYLVSLPVQRPSDAFGTACELGHVPAMRLLWTRFGEACWIRNSPTALMRAAVSGSAEAVRLLVELGADVDDFDLKDDLSPLMLAAQGGHLDAARALLDAGADPGAVTEWSVTAMRIAEARADGPMIELLRARGATAAPPVQHLHVIMPYATYTTAVPQPRERSPLDEALARDDATALATIAPRDLERTLIAAIHASAYRCVTSLLAAGPIALDGAITAAAVDQSDPWLLRDMLARGAPIDRSPSGQRSIMAAVVDDRWAHIPLLLERGAAFDEDLNGDSPLVVAARLGHTRSMTVLLDHELATGGLQIIQTPGRYREHLNGLRRIDLALLETDDPAATALLIARGADVAVVDRLRR